MGLKEKNRAQPSLLMIMSSQPTITPSCRIQYVSLPIPGARCSFKYCTCTSIASQHPKDPSLLNCHESLSLAPRQQPDPGLVVYPVPQLKQTWLQATLRTDQPANHGGENQTPPHRLGNLPEGAEEPSSPSLPQRRPPAEDVAYLDLDALAYASCSMDCPQVQREYLSLRAAQQR